MNTKKALLFIVACTIFLGFSMNPQKASADKDVVIEPNKEYKVTMAGVDNLFFYINSDVDCKGTIYIYDIKTTYSKYSSGQDDTKTYKDTSYNRLFIDFEDFDVDMEMEYKTSCSFSGSISRYKNKYQCTDFYIGNALPLKEWNDPDVYTLLYTTFKVKVITKSYSVPGSAAKIEEGVVGSNSCEFTLVFRDSDYETSKIRIYRKSSSRGKYKLIKTKKRSLGDDEMEYVDKKLKRNKCYWYKVSTYNKETKQWSKKSKAVIIWTAAPRPKIKRNGSTITWKKTKGVKGYIVQEEWKEMAGYNIFGNKLTDHYVKSYFTEKTTYRLKNAGRGNVSVTVYPYFKHGKKYYRYGICPELHKKDLLYEHYDRHVG